MVEKFRPADKAQLDELDKELAQIAPPKAAEPEPAAAAAKNAGSVKGGKKKAKKSGPEILWTVRVENFYKFYKSKTVEVLSGLRAEDRPTRRMALLFLLSSVGLVTVLALAGYRFWHLRQVKLGMLSESQEQAKNIGDFLAKQADEAKHRFSMLQLGSFTVELKSAITDGDDPAGKPKRVSQAQNLAEVEIVIECDNKDTRKYIEEHLTQAKNQVVSTFTGIDREEILTREGKKKLKRAIIDRLNVWLPKGKVEELYFSRLLLT